MSKVEVVRNLGIKQQRESSKCNQDGRTDWRSRCYEKKYLGLNNFERDESVLEIATRQFGIAQT